MAKIRRLRLLVMALGVAATLALSACGHGGQTPPTTTITTSAAQRAAAAKAAADAAAANAKRDADVARYLAAAQAKHDADVAAYLKWAAEKAAADAAAARRDAAYQAAQRDCAGGVVSDFQYNGVTGAWTDWCSGGNATDNGATAMCNDGTYSYAAHHQGACSHHDGVAVFYK